MANKLVLDPDGPCQKCGKDALDTGWECTACGFDNRDFYYPERDRSKDLTNDRGNDGG